ncbi:MAG: hypothetical protein JXB00_15230 [Bacteroidales bacterium]|nr:hypothetical protein [Bacteroidales bacterium]
MKRYNLIIINLLLLSCLLNGQVITDRNFTLTQPLPNYTEYQAKEYIKMIPGFHLSGTSTTKFRIDEELVINAYYLTPDEIVNPDTRDVTLNTTVMGVTGMASIDDKGAGIYSIPIEVPPGTNGLQPGLSINYNSQTGMGNLGMGWFINCENAITRTNQVKGIKLTTEDEFALNGNRLLNLNNINSDEDQTYSTEIPTFVKIIAKDSKDNKTPTHFIVKGSDGSISEYGNTDDSKLKVNSSTIPLLWALNKYTDAHGNTMEYEYYNEDSNGRIFLKSIKYCKSSGSSTYLNEIRFYYDQYDTRLVRYFGNNSIQQNVILNKVRIYSNGNILHEYNFDYLSGDHPRLSAVNKNINGIAINSCLIRWGNPTNLITKTSIPGDVIPIPANETTVIDINGDGIDDIISKENSILKVYFTEKDGDNLEFIEKKQIPIESSVAFFGYFNYDNFADIVVGKVTENVSVSFTLYAGGREGIDAVGTNGYTPFFCAAKEDVSICPEADFNGDGLTDFIIISDLGGSVFNRKVYITGHGAFDAQDLPLYNTTDEHVGNIVGGPGYELVSYRFSQGYYKVFEWINDKFVEKINIPYNASSGQDIYTVGDYNGDGFDDIIDLYGNIYISNGIDGIAKTEAWNVPANKSNGMQLIDRNGDGIMEIALQDDNERTLLYSYGEFNGDGATDKITKTISDGNITLEYNDNVRPAYLVDNIYDGYNGSSKFAYKPVSEASYYYSRTKSVPLADFKGLMYAVSSLTLAKKGIENRVITNTYEPPYTDQWGYNQKGFIGFAKIITNDDATNTETTKDFQFITKYGTSNEDTYIAPYLLSINVKDKGTNERLNLVTNTPGVAETFCSGSLNLYTQSTVVIDYFDQTSTTTYCKPNEFGQPAESGKVSVTTVYESGITENKTFVYYPSDKVNEAWKIGKIQTNTISKTHYDKIGETYTITYDYSYQNEGKDLYKITVNKDKPGGFDSDEYSYFANGNMQSHIQGSRMISYSYDTYGRFQTEEIDANNDKIIFTHDLWGNVITSKSSLRPTLVTTNTFNNLGRLIRSDYPNGSFETYSVTWAGSAEISGSQIQTATISSDGSQSIVETDGAGQILRTKTTNNTGSFVIVDKSYYPSGLLKTESLPYAASGGIKKDITYTYKNGMIETQNGPGVDLTYTYMNGSNQHDVKVKDNLTQLTTTTTYNDAGQVKKVIEPDQTYTTTSGNSIEYKYYASSDVWTIAPSGSNNTTTFFYDEFGRQTGILDPNMGTFTSDGKTLSIKYTYNQWNELTDKQDAEGNIYSASYNILGQIESETQNSETTIFNYYTSGTNKNRLEYTERSDIRYTYTYDAIGNILSKKEKVDGIDYLFEYTYDSENRMSTMKYPTDLTLLYTYDKGYLKKITNNVTSQEYWNAIQMDDKGSYTKVDKGGIYQTEYAYIGDAHQLDYITSKVKSTGVVIQNIDYSFNTTDFNLDNRADKLRGNLKETFGYDNLNRLISSSITKTGNPTITSTIAYTATGTPAAISSKTGLGQYSYITDKPYQVESVANTSALINSVHELTYTGFNKVATVTDFTNNYILSIAYGPDNSRKTSHLTQNGTDIRKRTYVGNFEIETDYITGTTRQLCYINSPTGIVGVVEKIGADETMYYVFTDHLGSWNVIADASGNKLQDREMSFDAWGNRRNVTTWANDASLRYNFYRGFTGHEHWDELGLLDMNGRFYDPVLGMFISPDPYVQDPSSSQNFNRYAYCLNNPLIYTDPDGEFFIPMLIGAAVSVITNGINNVVHHQSFFKGVGKAALIGGIGGAFSFGIGQAAMGMSGFGKVAFQTLAHSHLGGMMSGFNGGSYSSGFLSGAFGSLAAIGTGTLLQNSSNFNQAIGMIGGGAVSGGIGSVIAGGNFWDGFRNGAISSGLNHGIHSGSFGEGLMMASITGRTRHLFGPDAFSVSGTFDVSSGISLGIEKGGLIILRGSEAGIYNLNDLGVGIGGVSVEVGAEFVKLYTSAATVMKSHFYGFRYEGNLSFTYSCINFGGTFIYAKHEQGFTIGYGATIGLDAIPINVSFNLNKGASTQYFHQLTPEIKKALYTW